MLYVSNHCEAVAALKVETDCFCSPLLLLIGSSVFAAETGGTWTISAGTPCVGRREEVPRAADESEAESVTVEDGEEMAALGTVRKIDLNFASAMKERFMNLFGEQMKIEKISYELLNLIFSNFMKKDMKT